MPRWRMPRAATRPPPESAALHLEAVAAHHRQLQQWADICPEDFADRAALVGAEIARIEGRELDAMHCYDRAIGSARANGFVHNEAIANELAGRFYAARGFEKIAYAYLRDARYGYLRWGADAKVRQLERLYPRLHVAEDGGAAGKASESVQQMDVTTVVKASQAVSSEIELPGLIETLMKIALQNAGADRGLLILSRHDDFWIEAEGQSNGDEFAVVMRQAPVSGSRLSRGAAALCHSHAKNPHPRRCIAARSALRRRLRRSPASQIDPLPAADEAGQADRAALF